MNDPRRGTVYLHIGTPKSGTTYVQSRLEANHQLAADQGVLWPGPGWGRQVRAVDELRRLPQGAALPAGGEWARIVEEVHAWSGGTAVISMEWMAGLTPHQLRMAMRSLRPSRVEVICTVRDLLRTVVAHWQETTKNYRTWSWEEFVRELVDEDADGPARRVFWRHQDVPAIIRRWASHSEVPLERFHVVTVPPQGADREILWDRFCSVVGLEGADFQPPANTNSSLGVVSSTLMHHVNLAATRQEVAHTSYKAVLHRRLAREILAVHRPQEAPISVDERTEAWVRQRAVRLIQELGDSGVNIVGDLEELAPGPVTSGRMPTDVSDTELLELCADALVALGISQHQEIAALRADNRRLREISTHGRFTRTVGAVARRIAARRQAARAARVSRLARRHG